MRMGTMLMILALAGTWMAQGPGAKTPAERPELTPRRAECGILMPEREESHDIARLVRADQFLDCERDGFPKHLAPPWKDMVDGENKLGDACAYFGDKAGREYPQVDQATLKLAANRCRLTVLQVTFDVLGTGPPPK